jgi:lysozyme
MLNKGDVDGAYKQFLKWDMVGKDHIPGLLNRRLAEQDLFLGE